MAQNSEVLEEADASTEQHSWFPCRGYKFLLCCCRCYLDDKTHDPDTSRSARREDATEEECHDNTEDGEQSKILSVEEVLLRGSSAETKDLRLHQLCEESQDDPVNQSGEAEHVLKNDDSAAGGETETKSLPPSVTNMKGSDTSTGELDKVKEVKYNDNNEISEQSVRENATLAEASPPPPQTDSPEAGELDENAAEIKMMCHPVKDPGDDRGRKSENESVTPPATKDKAGAVNMDMSRNKDESVENSEEINRKSQNRRETETLFGRLNLQDKRQQKFSSADFPEGGSSVKQDHETSRREDATEEECHDNTEDGEQSKILSVEEVLLTGISAETKDLRFHQLCEESQDDPVNQSGEAEHSVKNDDSTAGGKSETKSMPPSVTNMKGSDTSTVKEVKYNDNNEISEQSVRENETLTEASPPPPQTDSPEAGELDENAAGIKMTCHPVKDPGDDRGRKSENESVTPPATKDKAGAVNMDMSGNKDESVENSEEINRKSQNQREIETLFGRLNLQDKRQQKFSSADFPEGGSSVKQDHETSRREDATEEECHDNTEDGEQSKILSVEEVLLTGISAETKDLRLHQLCEESQDDPVNQSEAEHSVKNDDSTAGGESETKPVPPSVTNMKGSDTSTGELDKVEEVYNEVSEQSARENETLTEASPPPPQTDSPEAGDLDENAAGIKMTCTPVKDPGDGGGRKSENESVTPPATKEKAGAVNMDMSGNKDESVENSEEINRKSQNQRETETPFGRLNLQDKRQQKFSSADFLKIGPPVKQDHETCEKDLAYSFLQRLMMLDYRARYIPVKQDSAEVSHSHPVETVDDDEDFLSTSVNQSEQSHVHPMDVQMAVFHCSDSFFKQTMVTKLSQCQYAVPLLVPDPVTMDIDCPLWALRKIRKTWKIAETEGDSNTVTMKSTSMCQAETPMVSFFRLGSLSLSKSQLMNTLINIRHDTFFHRNCPGSTKSRYLMDGVAEIAWYCPAGKPNDALTDCTAFCNLHGDALLNEKQRDILTEKSSVNVAFVETLEKGDKSASVISALLKSQKPLIILIADSDSATVQKKGGKYKMGLKDRGQADVSEELKGIIRNILSGQHTSFKLETMATVSGIRVDEADQVCQEGKSVAMKIDKLLQKMNVSQIKCRFLPCHGQLWHKWCKTNKALYHLKGNIEQEKSKKQEELKQIRQEQRTASCSELIKLFIESLSSLKSTEREYFLKWTQIFIDALSTDDLSSILQSYDEKWSEVLTLKKKHDKSEGLKKKQAELNQISTKLHSATFGLEHIFREMGQIYEAHASLEKRPMTERTDWSKYPELAAELMISGHPMELMDGDAGHVPLTWIFSLLDEVIKKLGDQKVFVLSVLGVQSSGKSTMLNAMFGLQFAVSAGRCTRGAFMQLVKVSEEMKKDFQFDYVLVVDTEGLRALELAGSATLHHDNELATFVVGLGNMTLINIFGENPADMQDVLQIVVQAFMRMKEVKLSPSCVFVHQNVTDVAAAEMNMDGKRRLQEKLDQMAQLAAKEEVCDAECFSDVIAFDVQEDVKYFAQLWEGSPPMAPPNPGYSESVQDLRNFILSKASKSAGITLSQFKSKVHDLWKALLNENFVFSFKNTHEIAVYRKLEVEYGKWTWALRKDMLTVENQFYNRIENGKLDKVELSCLQTKMKKTSEEVKRDLATYFDDNEDKEMLVQWRGRFENKIKEFHDDQVRGVKRKLDEVIQQKKARIKLDDKKTEFENKLLQMSKELAHQLKDKGNNEEERRKQFDFVWQGLVTELTKDIKPIEDINYEEDQLNILHDLGFEWFLLEQSKQGGNYKNMSMIGDYTGYTSLTNTGQQLQGNEKEKGIFRQLKGYAVGKLNEVKEKMKGSLSFEEQQQIRFLIADVEKESLDTITSKPVATRGYSSAYLQEVATNVKEKVAAFESKWKYALKKDFTVDLVLYVFDRAEKWLSESHKKFQVANDALSYLDGKKGLYYNIFRSFCKGSSSAVVLGELICEKLKTSTVEAVCNKTAIDLAGEIRCSYPPFSGNRLNLEKHVLKALAEKGDFDGFINYIQRPRDQVEIFIKDEVQKYIFTEQRDKAQKVVEKNSEDINTLLSQALFDATEKVKTQEGNTEMWMEEFSCLLQDKLKFTICYSNFNEKDTESKTENKTDQKDLEKKRLDVLKEEIENGLKSIKEETSSLSLDEMNKFRMKPDEILINQLCKCCWVKCPFCGAVCTNTMENHSPDKHNVPFHRPSGIIGWHFRDTDELDIDFCTTLVASNGRFRPSHSDVSYPYKEYPKAGGKYAEWIITPDESKLTYWKWFVCRFQKQLEEHHNLKFHGRGEIPDEWRKYSKDEAIESLDEMYNLQRPKNS